MAGFLKQKKMEEQAKKLKEKLEKNYDVRVFTENVELEALKQIESLAGLPVFSGKKIRIMPDVHAGAGVTIGFTGNLGEKVVPNVVGVDIGCLDCDTEVLTPEGWIRIADYVDQEILQFDPKNNIGKFIIPKLYIKETCEEFYHFKNAKGLDQVVSEEHKLLIYYGHGYKSGKSLKFKTLSPTELSKFKLEKGHYRAKTCFKIESKGIDISDEMIRIDIMVQADGCIKNKYPDYHFVELHFRKERKIERAKELLTSAGISFNEKLLKDGSTNISFHAPTYIDKTLKKYYKANLHQLKIVTEECLKWDGHEGYRSFYSSTNKENIDVIQFAFIATDTRASLYKVPSKIKHHSTCYHVIPTRNPFIGYNSKPTKVKSIDGYKYCFNTDTGYFLTRRNGYTFLTGNCGMRLVNLGPIPNPDFHSFHEYIKANVPSGQIAREEKKGFKPLVREEMDIYREAKELVKQLKCYRELKNSGYINASIGTLGGGNHFIELDRGETDGNLYLVIHTGSRNLGKQVADIYQKIAVKNHMGWDKLEEEKKALIEKMKSEGRRAEIQEAIKELHRQFKGKKSTVPDNLCWLEGEYKDNYLHDMRLCQKWAELNRKLIAILLKKFFPGVSIIEEWECVHNYIADDNIVRKGAISAREGELNLIPLNMRDGSLICIGKGNPDWNYSAPHGAGRILSRKKAYEQITIKDFRDSMKGIYSETITDFTRDEAPMVYKPADEIKSLIGDTVDIREVIKPVFNFKADN